MKVTRPLGYWLKQLDGLIERAFDRLLAEEGLQRRHWQTLQLLHASPAGESAIAAALAPFFGDASPGPHEVLTVLCDRGWVHVTSDQYALSPAGVEANARIAEHVGALRRQTAAGISNDEYAATLAVLERMADNLAVPAATSRTRGAEG